MSKQERVRMGLVCQCRSTTHGSYVASQYRERVREAEREKHVLTLVIMQMDKAKRYSTRLDCTKVIFFLKNILHGAISP